jgi:hypothetical protein
MKPTNDQILTIAKHIGAKPWKIDAGDALTLMTTDQLNQLFRLAYTAGQAGVTPGQIVDDLGAKA